MDAHTRKAMSESVLQTLGLLCETRGIPRPEGNERDALIRHYQATFDFCCHRWGLIRAGNADPKPDLQSTMEKAFYTAIRCAKKQADVVDLWRQFWKGMFPLLSPDLFQLIERRDGPHGYHGPSDVEGEA